MNGLKSLLPQTESVLIEIADKSFFEKFTFVGGSAISIYLDHRKSEDLDFFTWEKQIDIERILSGFHSEKLTVFLRAKYRDYYDLYTLCKEKFTIIELFNLSQALIPNINIKLFQTALVFTDDIDDDNIGHLFPKYTISKNEISKFFIKEIKKWNMSMMLD
jgi:predicted nucleotidyltransferase component of viral defense system